MLEGSPSLEDIPVSMEDNSGTAQDGQGDGSSAASQASTAGLPGLPGGAGGGYGSRSDQATPPGVGGAITPAEQVAILDRQLEQSTSDFDSMILGEQTEQRRAERERAEQVAAAAQAGSSGTGPSGGSAGNSGNGSGTQPGSLGGGMAGAAGGGKPPPDVATYPPPGDIPNGDDDDVVARQLREAAMREPDPKVREKLWDEYRKYKGIK
jgi:hypothetical protein